MPQEGIWGWYDTLKKWVKVAVDTDGKLIISDADPFTITQDTPEDLKHLPHGYYPTGGTYKPFEVDVNGRLLITLSNLAKLNDIDDVFVPAPTDEYFIYWDDPNSRWACRALVAADLPAHKDTHDPQDGSDKLDTAAPVKVGAANAIGTSHSLARADHVHEREHAKYLDAAAVAAAEAAGLALATGKNIKLIANLTADHTWSGLSAVLQAGEEVTIGEVCYVKNDGKMWLAQADSATTMPCVALATGTIAADAWGEFLLIGFFRDDSITFTLGDMLYVSDTVAGDFDNVLPADAGEQVQVIGKCLVSTHIVYFNPSLELVEIAA